MKLILSVLMIMTNCLFSAQNDISEFAGKNIEKITQNTFLIYIKNSGKQNEMRICCEKQPQSNGSSIFYCLQNFKKTDKMIIDKGLCHLRNVDNLFVIQKVYVYDKKSEEYCLADYNSELFEISFGLIDLEKVFVGGLIFSKKMMRSCNT
ncbi:MAG: hypothetical protein FGM14_05520 [Flavobacteriales bacterium]|nr:hypothetical protein [Flavobacteriales bacterium]